MNSGELIFPAPTSKAPTPSAGESATGDKAGRDDAFDSLLSEEGAAPAPAQQGRKPQRAVATDTDASRARNKAAPARSDVMAEGAPAATADGLAAPLDASVGRIEALSPTPGPDLIALNALAGDNAPIDLDPVIPAVSGGTPPDFTAPATPTPSVSVGGGGETVAPVTPAVPNGGGEEFAWSGQPATPGVSGPNPGETVTRPTPRDTDAARLPVTPEVSVGGGGETAAPSVPTPSVSGGSPPETVTPQTEVQPVQAALQTRPAGRPTGEPGQQAGEPLDDVFAKPAAAALKAAAKPAASAAQPGAAAPQPQQGQTQAPAQPAAAQPPVADAEIVDDALRSPLTPIAKPQAGAAKTANPTASASAASAAKPAATSAAAPSVDPAALASGANATADKAALYLKPAAPAPFFLQDGPAKLDLAPAPVEGDVDIELSARMDLRGAAERPGAASGRLQPHSVANLAAQITRRFVSGARTFEIRMDPPELGRVDVKLELGADQRVQAMLSAERPETLNELQRAARELERALAEAGLDLAEDGLSFELSEGGDQEGGENGGEDTIDVYADAGLGFSDEEAGAPVMAHGFQLARRSGVNLTV
jgi:hypothetical protein